jgi:phosphohistidine phosphatase SixA
VRLLYCCFVDRANLRIISATFNIIDTISADRMTMTKPFFSRVLGALGAITLAVLSATTLIVAPHARASDAKANASVPAVQANEELPKPSLFDNALPHPSAALNGSALVQALKQGGFVIYIRHAQHTVPIPKESPEDAARCTHANHLAEVGIQHSKMIATFFAAEKIPISKVLSSPACRVVVSARSMFNKVEIDNRIAGEPKEDPLHGNFGAIAAMMTAPVAPTGTNLVLVGHVTAMQKLAGTPLLEWGEAAIIQPKKDGKPVIVSRLKATEWSSLMNAGRAP